MAMALSVWPPQFPKLALAGKQANGARIALHLATRKVCEGCLVSKQPRSTFKKYAPSRAPTALHVVHSDACGPIQTPSLGDNRYFVTFVDEYTRKIWLYLIKVKSEVLPMFQKFLVMAERQCGNKLKILRTDGGESTILRSSENFVKRKALSMK